MTYTALLAATLTLAVSDLDTSRQQALAEHNALRRVHAAPPLTLDSELNNLAQDWARHLAHKGVMQHRPNNPFGENIYMAYSSNGYFDESGAIAVKHWFSEISQYDFRHPVFSPATGHFTQVVWKSTQRLGCGQAKSPDGRSLFVVCNYDPPGNYTGLFPQNVLPASR